MYNKVQDSGKKDAGSGKRNFNIKININNKMTLPDGRHGMYLCIKVKAPSLKHRAGASAPPSGGHFFLGGGQKSRCVWMGKGIRVGSVQSVIGAVTDAR